MTVDVHEHLSSNKKASSWISRIRTLGQPEEGEDLLPNF